MNIFVVHSSPQKCANYLDDKRVVKMVLETAQLLATSINLSGGNAFYKTTHKNHPCSIWVRQSRGNYLWTLELFKELCKEYTKRYGKIHACHKYTNEFIIGMSLIPEGKILPFVNCTPFKNETDVFEAYKKYLNEKWNKDKRKPRWFGNEKNRNFLNK